MKWTQFWDMHSGGGSKEPQTQIYIEAPEDEARVIFYNKFGHNPDRVTCTCCGSDYSVSESDSLLQATAYQRGCKYAYMKDGKEIPKSEGFIRGKGTAKGVVAGYIEKPDDRYAFNEYKTLEEYLVSEDALFIYDKDILPEWRSGELPQQGFVWVD